VPGPEPPRSVDDLTPAWCTAALARRIGPARVTSCPATPIGTGQVADTVRLVLGYDPPGAGPATCVVKLPSASAASRSVARATHAYAIEAGFYRDLAPHLPVRRPACFHAGYDDRTGGYAVLLEDLSGARPADQLAGCDAGEIAAATVQLARLHATHWGDPAVAALPWMPAHDQASAARMETFVASVRVRFLRRFGDRLHPEVTALVDRFIPRVGRYLADRPGPRTVVHGDFRADNLMVDGTGVIVLDWQTVGYEPGVTDLAYLLGASVTTDERRRIEAGIVGLYTDELRERGVDLSPDGCWAAYRRYAFDGLLMVLFASALVARSDRGDEMFVAMANRHGRHALDLDAEEFLTASVN
jgi:aminoglycoside phosphotransferase (APT) family kinase protein